jgi:predicted nucleotide-binding protein (sugar kinase/HSP70/actin superfamily)
MEQIAGIALQGQHPPNFNDQCAAFISSDIKNAIQEGVGQEDILAGLVYSICMNYTNRVKGNRPVGRKVFMQGGVCYNRAVPLAMAALVDQPIVVPPEPGLMGAFGVALAVKERMDSGRIAPKSFDLRDLAGREVAYGRPFVCHGGAEKCDRRCQIAVILLEGKKYPFGGACNRYDNLRRSLRYDVKALDLVRVRQRMVFEAYAVPPLSIDGAPKSKDRCGRIGFNRSFLVNTYYPLYATFFTELGYAPVLDQRPSQAGIDQRNAPFCYPAELAHGFFHRLISAPDPPDYIFLPHFKAVPSQDGAAQSQVCPLVQGETFYLRTTFRKKLAALEAAGTRLLTPLIDLSRGLETAREPLLAVARRMGASRRSAEAAFAKALEAQRACLSEMKRVGRLALEDLAADPEKIAVVIVSRPYSGFAEEAHMGIPHKFATRGIMVLPVDFLPFEEEKSREHMYWGMGQVAMMGAQFVKRHPQLFATYITNFSCGPDSFIVGYFRSIMGRKPSLTLELDSHTADAGLETRIEAFLDVVAAYRQPKAAKRIVEPMRTFSPARTVIRNGSPQVVTSGGEMLPIKDPRVTILFPSMGRLASEGIAAMFAGKGFHTFCHPPADEAVMKLGRQHTSGKECLPLILTTGTLLNHLQKERRNGEIVVYFMPTGSGPCRFGQYQIFMQDLIARLQLPDVAVLSLSSDNAYAGLDGDYHLRGWWVVIVSDAMEDIRSMLLANAVDPPAAMALFEELWQTVLDEFQHFDPERFAGRLREIAAKLARIPLKRPTDQVPTISLTGEIFVRRDGLSRRYLTERLAGKGFAAVCTPIAEWMHYCDYMVSLGINQVHMTARDKVKFYLKKTVMAKHEKRIRKILAGSGLITATPVGIQAVIQAAAPYISDHLPGEALLTIGGAMHDVASHTCGIIAIGPFGCMPNRLAEAVLSETMTRADKLASDPDNRRLRSLLEGVDDLPFLAIESDGAPFPQLIHAKLEAFCLRAERLHQRMLSLA